MISAKHITQNLLAGLLMVVMLSSAWLIWFSPQTVSAWQTQQELDSLREQQAALEEQWQAARDNLEAFQTDQDLAKTNLAWLLERNDEQQALYKEYAYQIAAITDLKKSLDRNLEIAIRQYEEKKENYGKRIEVMYELQKKSPLELLLESDSLTSYFSILRFMKLISDADEQDLIDLRQERDDITRQYEETTKKLDQLSQVLMSIEQDMGAIQDDIDAYESSIASLDGELAALYGVVEQYSNDHFLLQASIDQAEQRKAEEEYLAQVGGGNSSNQGGMELEYSGNGFIWPCPQSDDISSEYGERSIPEFGIYDFHTGMDFAADFGAPCVASAAGQVIFAGWYNDFAGNTVRIDVGSGIVIMYCHLDSFNVADGQWVNAGEVIAAVGSTGNSTGPHLHFQVEVGGSHVNPRLYLY